MSRSARSRPSDAVRCPECDATVEGQDELADHLTEDHDLFSWVQDGRPIDSVKKGEGQ